MATKKGKPLSTKEKVRKARKSLEKTTKKAFRKLRQAEIKTWKESHLVVLD